MRSSNKQATIQFWKLKTFNEKVNASISFLRVHWKPLLKANATIAGPFYVLGIGLLLFYMQVFLQNIISTPYGLSDELDKILSMFLYTFVAGIFYLIALIGILLVTFEYVKLAQENSPNRFNTRIIFNNCRKRFWKLIGAGLLTILAFFILSLILSVVTGPFLFMGAIGIILIFLLRLITNLVFYAMLYIYIPMSYYEQKNNTSLFGRSKSFLQKDLWQTSGMYLGNRAIQYILANGLLIPFIAGIFWWIYYKIELLDANAMLLFTENRYIFYIFMLVIFLYLLVNTAFNIFHVLSSAVQYFALKEKHDGDSIFKQIEQFEMITDEV